MNFGDEDREDNKNKVELPHLSLSRAALEYIRNKERRLLMGGPASQKKKDEFLMQNRICLTQAQNDVPVPDVPREGPQSPGPLFLPSSVCNDERTAVGHNDQNACLTKNFNSDTLLQ